MEFTYVKSKKKIVSLKKKDDNIYFLMTNHSINIYT